ncbi:trimeric intracellular cation channel family protein [Halorubellus sp. JP-L1]|uniref:trimeric intracellular cation channel family protein n=1 Tax=Halorubellus sp. JP-L1 TaxID=2715753 RepID=UPI00140E884B|nr:TRIC cation channel family protein [Halorubellus sp. JP-L1]NHN42373.1 trimeric intracellular cation channel family protein [Halorubellus sp. JP-L1]
MTAGPVLSVSAFDALNWLGLLAFALAGSLDGADEGLDALGVVVLGVVTALGGGITRDLLVDRTPVALTATADVAVVMVGVVVAVLLVRRGPSIGTASPAVQVPDAVGLAAFAATGAIVAWDAGLSAFGVLVCAMLTGTGGGAIRDLLVGRTPGILVEDFYATCALVGAVAFWLLRTAGAPAPIGIAACVGLAFVLRVLAIRFDWHLPTVG